MSTGKEIAARVAAEFGGVKPWGDELRAENARLKAVPMKYKRMAFNAELQAENARLRDALTTARTALIEHGSAYLHHELRYQEALDAARAALGEKA